MLLRNFICAFFLLLLPILGIGQLENKVIKRAEIFEKNLSYADAIETYQSFLAKEKNLDLKTEEIIKLRLANLYYLVKDYGNAEELFGTVLQNAPSLSGDELKVYLTYAQVLASNGKHKLAAEQWKKYSALSDQDKRASSFLKLYSNLDALTKNAASYEVEYIGLNTASPDFSPAYYNGGMVFVSGREQNKAIKRVFSWDNSSFLDLYLLEDLNQLNTSKKAAGVSSGGGADSKKKSKKGLSKLGSDYYTAPSANDNRTIGHTGSAYINGSQDYDETPSIETKKFSKALNSKYHEGPCSFFHNGKRVVFTRNALDGFGLFSGKKDNINRLHLYFADKTEKDWKNITGFPYNNPNYSTGHPSISSEDNILYFVSDMPGGFGGTDIYYSILKNDKWSKPQNLGGVVNTQGNEMFPFLDENDNLYFSSDGHPGLGDMDLFFVEIDKVTMTPSTKVRNLGAPLNSSKDDFGLVTNDDRLTGYFSSNRKRGGADDDIYKFERIGEKYGCRELILAVIDKITKKPIENLSFVYQNANRSSQSERGMLNSNGNIKLCLPADNEFYINFDKDGYKPLKKFYSNFDASDFEPTELTIELIPLDPIIVKPKAIEKQTNRILTQRRDVSNARKFKGVMLAGENQEPIGGVKVKFINKCNGQVQEVYTKKDGSYEFERDPECDYELVAFKNEFATSFELIEKSYTKTLFNKKKRVTSNYEGPRSLFDTKLYKVGDVVQLENIYFSSDSYKLEKKALQALDDLVEILKRYPNMIIEVYAHTDTRGNGLDNLYLSQLRAKEVERYLSKRGISKARIKAIGMGEKKPLNNCGDGVQCTEAEHQRNRRTEFKILQIQKVI